MANPDSFIDEVTEEVRRDRLFRVMRRYGWIAVVLVLGIVGGTAWNEWSKARDRAAAQAFGDAVIAALDGRDASARRDALAAIEATGERAAILRLMLSAEAAAIGSEASRA